MATKDECEDHKKKRQYLYGSIFAVIVILGAACLIARLVLNPKNPRFMIQDATFYNFSVSSSPDVFTFVFQVTIISENPNDRIDLYYHNLQAVATYRDQIISLPTSIPSSYQGHRDSDIWSPFIQGINSPISPYHVYALNQDQATGFIPVTIKITGNVKWKADSLPSIDHQLYATCPIIIPHGNQIQLSIKYPLSVNCKLKS